MGISTPHGREDFANFTIGADRPIHTRSCTLHLLFPRPPWSPCPIGCRFTSGPKPGEPPARNEGARENKREAKLVHYNSLEDICSVTKFSHSSPCSPWRRRPIFTPPIARMHPWTERTPFPVKASGK